MEESLALLIKFKEEIGFKDCVMDAKRDVLLRSLCTALDAILIFEILYFLKLDGLLVSLKYKQIYFIKSWYLIKLSTFG